MMNSLVLARSLLLRGFIVGLVILWLSAAVYYGLQPTWIGLFSSMFHFTDTHTLGVIVLCWFSLADLTLFLAFLVPGLAIHWTLLANKHP